MKRALVVALVVLAGAIAAFFLWPDPAIEPVRGVAEGAFSPPPERTTGSAIVRPGGAADVAEGRVVDGAGRGLGGAQVFLAREGGDSLAELRCECPVCQKALLECPCPAGTAQVAALVSHREGEILPDRTITAGADGRFRFPDPPPGPWLVWATAQGFAPAFRHDVEAGKTVELALGPSQAIWGRVVDETDAPVPGALLTAVPTLLPRFAEVTSGPDGSYRLEGIALGPTFLVAVAQGYLPAGLALSVPAGGPTPVTLARPRTLVGTVRERKQPAKNVFVRLNSDHSARVVPSPEGAFRLEGLAPGTYTVAATAGKRFATAQVELDKLVTEVTLDLEEGLAVRGRVFDDAGAPVGGAAVNATLGPRRLADTRSDDEGRFSLDGLPVGTRLTATREGFEPGTARVTGDAEEVELVLHGQATVVGIVVSAHDEPLPQVQVVARGAGRGVATSDAAGVFKLALPSPGPVTLLAHHSTYGAGEVSVDAPAIGVKLKLSTMGAIRARVVDPAGKPVAGAKATAWKDDPALQRFDTFSSDIPSGEDGVVVLAGLPPGAHRVRLLAKGHQAAERRNVPVPANGEIDLGDVALEAGLEIAGVVLTDEGAPATGAFVHARAKGHRTTEGIPVAKDGSFVIGGLKEGTYAVFAFQDKAVAEATARTGDRGVTLRLPAAARLRGRVLDPSGRPMQHFTVDGNPVETPDGRFEVRARAWRENVFFRVGADGYLTSFKQARLEGSIAEAGDVVLERALSIEGVVQDEAGAPVSGAAVMVGEREELAAQDEAPSRAVSGAGGRFRLEGFSPGPVALLARKGSLVAEHSLLLEEEDLVGVVLTLKGKGTIEGVVRGPDGKPTLAEVHTRTGSTTSDAQGRYKLDGLVPGTYLVLAVLDSDSYRSTSKEVQVKAGETSRLDFDLGAGGSLRVSVAGASRGTLHLLRTASSGAGTGVHTAASQTAAVDQGHASVGGLQEGRYTVLFYGPGETTDLMAEGTVDVPASGSVQLQLTARPMTE